VKSVENNAYLERKEKYFKHVKKSDWESWQWQTKHRITNAEELEKYIKLTDEERHGVNGVLKKIKNGYYAILFNFN
jgi:lysine 2,3-aminomutase